MNKRFFILGFLIIGLFAGFLLSETSMSVSNKIKAFYTNTEEAQSEAEGPPIYFRADELSELEEAPDLSKAKWRKIIVIGDLPFEAFMSKGSNLRNTIITVVIVLSVLLIAFLWYRFNKKRAKKQINNVSDSFKDSTNKRDGDENLKLNSNVLPVSNKEMNEIRATLRQWENRLSPIKKRRKNETIAEWFHRINGPVGVIPLYEKVRYGYEEVTKDEYNKFTKMLK